MTFVCIFLAFSWKLKRSSDSTLRSISIALQRREVRAQFSNQKSKEGKQRADLKGSISTLLPFLFTFNLEVLSGQYSQRLFREANVLFLFDFEFYIFQEAGDSSAQKSKA